MLKVLIGGHPNTGTSFLCELVVAMGFSPGPAHNLKAADDHNPHGYWEHLPLQGYVRKACGYSHEMHQHGLWPTEPLDFEASQIELAGAIAESDGVEVFKDCCAPLACRLFPGARFVAITRTPRDVRLSGKATGDRPVNWHQGWDRYHKLLKRVAGETDYLLVSYEAFREDFYREASRVAVHLGVEPDLDTLRAIWRPRK
jgi:hypothetical protein